MGIPWIAMVSSLKVLRSLTVFPQQTRDGLTSIDSFALYDIRNTLLQRYDNAHAHKYIRWVGESHGGE